MTSAALISPLTLCHALPNRPLYTSPPSPSLSFRGVLNEFQPSVVARTSAPGWHRTSSRPRSGPRISPLVSRSSPSLFAVGDSLFLAVDDSLFLAVGDSLFLAVGDSLFLAVGDSLFPVLRCTTSELSKPDLLGESFVPPFETDLDPARTGSERR